MAQPHRRILPPWRDRQGQFSPLKLGVLLGLALPALWTAWLAAQGNLGARPIMEAVHQAGLWAVRILLLSLLITPLKQMLRWPRLMLVRRMVGLGALAYAVLHLTLYALDLDWNLVKVASEIVLRFYLAIGFVALLGLAALGVTSTDGWVRRLGGRRWQRLHRIVYGIGVLALVHFALQSKIDVTEAMLMAGLFLWLMGYRAVAPKGGAPGLLRLGGLALGAALGTALLEAGWYAVATGVPPLAVLEANFDVSFGLRPALWVGIAGGGAVLLRAARQLRDRLPAARPAH
ncbi:sulfoxide reductase heme-binding subunit YedZ [Roseomonas sp. M0104]|uniref:Protein-methionine-sulfoxide reductase heme-binding subunit MsrQ n=1 Tax=Teichococcus coralli TaxID=2545983 RepID=A0A845B7Y5_9PROT|nr:protein-methionine-sulfoxide reductase heme-binding subunit MsrQ [Pseudoroseomonas coralli]MXP63281.1 sulfoxide reductase heme-binding subunit YedZ [Pseudoroseomonas coralli]